jgi:hypothetical protein
MSSALIVSYLVDYLAACAILNNGSLLQCLGMDYSNAEWGTENSIVKEFAIHCTILFSKTGKQNRRLSYALGTRSQSSCIMVCIETREVASQDVNRDRHIAFLILPKSNICHTLLQIESCVET